MENAEMIDKLLDFGKSLQAKSIKLQEVMLGRRSDFLIFDEEINRVIELINLITKADNTNLLLGYFNGKFNTNEIIEKLENPAPIDYPVNNTTWISHVVSDSSSKISSDKNITIDVCLNHIRKAAQTLGTSFQQKQYNEFAVNNELYPFNRFRHLFWDTASPWKEAIKRANLTDNEINDSVIMSEKPELEGTTIDNTETHSVKKRGRKPHFNKQNCIEALKNASLKLGNSFTQKEYSAFAKRNKGYPCTPTILKQFEHASWSSIMRTAGIKSPRQRSK